MTTRPERESDKYAFMTRIIYILVAIAAVLLVICGFAHGENSTVEIYIDMNTTEPTPEPIWTIPTPPAPDLSASNQTFIPYLYQGDAVYVGTYVDISGVAPPYPSLAYWDGYDMYDEVPSYNYSLPDGKRGYYQFYIDPEIFASRLGWWFKYGGKFEQQGNNRAFFVLPQSMWNVTMRLQNGTLVNITNVETVANYTPHVIPEAPVMPEKHVSDYVAAKGDPIIWADGGYHLWIFGRVSGIYDNPGNIITADMVQTLENGHYTVVVQTAGNDTNYDARYNATSKTLDPYRYGRTPVDINGLAPSVVYDRLKTMLAGTDDGLYEYSMELDIPQITINQVDEVYRDSSSYLDVRGYTNTANGTRIDVSLDENGYSDFKASTHAIRTSNGNMSYYSAYVPFNYDDLAADARNHTLVARTALGGESSKDFKISLMPADSFKPNATLKYIEDRNPFVPTPTPATVYVTRTVPVTVTVPVPPSDEQVYAQQKAAEDAKWSEAVAVAGDRALLVVLGAILGGLIWYIASVLKRGKKGE